MKFRLTKGNFLKTGAYIDGDSAIFTFAAEKEDACSIVLLDKSEIQPVSLIYPVSIRQALFTL